jgi:hypothetical protein
MIGHTLYGEEPKSWDETKLNYIWQMMKDLKKIVDTSLVMQIEDDTLPPRNTFKLLYKDIKSDEKVGLASAIETGRGPEINKKTRVGVHYIVRDGNKLIKRISLDPNTKEVVEVDATGWYCYLAKTKAWRAGFEGMDEYVKEIPLFALDNFHTNNIKRAGYKLLADFRLKCWHLQLMGNKIYIWKTNQAIQMMDVWIDEAKNYAQGVVIK